MDEKGLGRLLQAVRVRAGLTQQALCQKAGLSYSTLTKIERGAIKAPSIFTVMAIADAVGMGLDALLTTEPGAPSLDKPKRQSKSGVRFVYFDVNGCLVKYYDQVFTKLAETSGAPFDVIETAYWHYNDRACRGEMTMDDVNAAFAKDIGVKSVDWLAQYVASIRAVPEMHDLIRRIAIDYRVGLLTNIMPGFLSVMRARNLIPDIAYDSIIDSSVEGLIKPEADIYHIAETRAGCPGENILFIDDNDVNLIAAERQGWHVIQFRDDHLSDCVERIGQALA